MRKFFLLGFCLIATSVVSAQVRGKPTPKPPTPLEKSVQQGRDISNRSNDLRNMENFPVRNEAERKVLRDQIQPLYRKPTNEERATLAASSEDRAKYASFIRGKKSGLVRLVADRGCSANTDVVKANLQCVEYTMPGAGSAFSFREKMHRLIRLADLNFKKNSLQSLGTLTHGIMVNVGDVPLEEASLTSKGAKYIVKLKPARNINKAAELANKLTKGIKEDGFLYASILVAKPNTTYFLRSIAYRGEARKAVGPYVYNELAFDKRRDIIIAFRIVRMEPGKSITVVWKELRNKKSPKIKVG